MSDLVRGVVLRATPVRESDLVVTLFTADHGRLSAVARGARRSHRRFAGALSLLVLARYQLGRRPRGEMWSLEAAEIEREWMTLASDVIAVAHASYVAELVGALFPPETPEPAALDWVIALYDSLAAGGPSPAVLRAIELGLLELAGHQAALDTCAACGGALTSGGTVFDPHRGGAICRRCAAISRGPGVRPFGPAARAYLQTIAAAGSDLAAVRSIDADPRLSAADRTSAREALVAMVTGVAGHALRSLEFIAKLGAAGRRP